MINYNLHTNILFGVKSIDKLENKILELDYKNLIFIIDQNILNTSIINNLIKIYKIKFKISIYVYEEKFEPSYRYIDLLSKKIKSNKQKIDCIIAIGGGSVMDTGKAIAILYKNKGKAIKFRGFPKKLNQPVPVIAIPTTAGTGSEIVYNASIIDEKTKFKMGINYYDNYPIYSVLDPRLISTAPLNVIISSAFDTIVHSIESFMSPSHNSFTRLLGIESLKISFKILPKIVKGEKNVNHYGKLQIASCLAMMALSNTSSGATGALSYFLGTNYKVPHGLAGALFIGKICKFNHKNGYLDYSEIYESIFNKKIKSKKQKSKLFIELLYNLITICKIPNNIYEFGYRDKEFEKIVSFYKNAKPAFMQNPIKFKINDIKGIVTSNYN